MNERFVDVPTPDQRDIAARGAPAAREVLARGIADGLCGADFVVFFNLVATERTPPPIPEFAIAVSNGVRAMALPLAVLAALAKGELGRRVRALRHTPGAAPACVVIGRGATFVGHLTDVGVSIEQYIELPYNHPALELLHRIARETAAAAHADVLAYAHAHGLAPGDVGAIVSARANIDAAGVVPTPADVGSMVAVEMSVGRRTAMRDQMRETHPMVSDTIASQPRAAHFWFVVTACGLIVACEVPLAADGVSAPGGAA